MAATVLLWVWHAFFTKEEYEFIVLDQEFYHDQAIYIYLVHEAHTIFAMAAASVSLLPEETSNTSFSYVPVLTCHSVCVCVCVYVCTCVTGVDREGGR